MRDTKEAFHWIIRILKKYEVPYQISGGLAAKIYGSSRPLADIDIDISEEKFVDILPDVKPYIIFGPERFRNENFDLSLITLNYMGQEIDLCSQHVKIRDAKTGEWHDNSTDFSRYELQEVYDITIPVIKKDDLVNYKKILGRPVDLEDIKQMSHV